ncbi:MAG TPA: hypothetical protein VGD31_17795, partial [Sphingobacteriaceae bacterium]
MLSFSSSGVYKHKKLKMVSVDDVLSLYGCPNNESAEDRVENAEALNTLNGATGRLTEHLCRLFNQDSRRSLRTVAISSVLGVGQLQGEWREVQNQLEGVVRELLDQAQATLVSEGVYEALGLARGEINDVDDAPVQYSKFFSFVRTEKTKQEYSRRIASALRLMLSLLDSDLRSRCKVVLDETTVLAIQEFHESPREVSDIKRLVLLLLSENRGKDSFYNREILCILPIAHFVSNTNNFTCSESAQKTISSIKYLCRSCVVLEIASLESGLQLKDISALRYLNCSKGFTSAFACLFRLHKGVCSIDRVVLDRVLYTTKDTLFVDSVDFSPKLLGEAVKSCYVQSQQVLHRLLMGYRPEQIATPAVVEHRMLANSAFGQEADTPDGNHLLLSYVSNNHRLYKKFFKVEGPAKLKRAFAKKFLRLCCKFEQYVIPLMHLLMGASSRGTDYEQLSFRSGGIDLPRRLVLLNRKLILVERQSRKT